MYCSFDEQRRKLVESSLIAQHKNCNNRPGDIPVCRVTAPQVLRSLKIDYKHSAPPSPDQNVVPAAIHLSPSTPSQLTPARPTQPLQPTLAPANPSPPVSSTSSIPSPVPSITSTQPTQLTTSSPNPSSPVASTSPIHALSLPTVPPTPSPTRPASAVPRRLLVRPGNPATPRHSPVSGRHRTSGLH